MDGQKFCNACLCISACLPLEAGGHTTPSLKYVMFAKCLPVLKALKKENKLNTQKLKHFFK